MKLANHTCSSCFHTEKELWCQLSPLFYRAPSLRRSPRQPTTFTPLLLSKKTVRCIHSLIKLWKKPEKSISLYTSIYLYPYWLLRLWFVCLLQKSGFVQSCARTSKCWCTGACPPTGKHGLDYFVLASNTYNTRRGGTRQGNHKWKFTHRVAVVLCPPSYDTWVPVGEVDGDVEDPPSAERPWKVRDTPSDLLTFYCLEYSNCNYNYCAPSHTNM